MKTDLASDKEFRGEILKAIWGLEQGLKMLSFGYDNDIPGEGSDYGAVNVLAKEIKEGSERIECGLNNIASGLGEIAEAISDR